MELEQLRIFLAVVEHGGFRAAAAALYISHSTTCRRVAALEESLGVRLLERSENRGMPRLTPAGEVLYREAAELLRHAEGTAELTRRAGGVSALQDPAQKTESFVYSPPNTPITPKEVDVV